MAKKKSETATAIVINAPKFKVISIKIEGTAPYMQCRFSAKAMEMMMAKMEAGSTAKTKRAKEARDFDADFEQAQHISTEGWAGIPAAAFRNAAIDACRVVNFNMRAAKSAIFIEADGFDRVDGTPLVKIISKEGPERTEMPVRIATTIDIRIRPMWREWSANLRVRFDNDMFTSEDVVNLILRAGQQVGVGEGRPYSKSSNGMGFGLFTVKELS